MRIAIAWLAVMMAASLPVAAQTSTPTGPGSAAQARPSRGPEQASVPNVAPPASTGQVTGAHDQSPTVKQMNEAERKKVEVHGK